MTTLTPYLNLITYSAVTDASALYATFRADVAGSLDSSNMFLIDTFANRISGSVLTLLNNVPVTYVQGFQISSNYFEASVTSIGSYVTGMVIIFEPDTTITGNTTLKINSLTTITLQKVNGAGALTALTTGDLKKGHQYIFRYSGTYWVWAGSISAEQISVTGGSGNAVIISGSNTLIDSGSPIVVYSGSPPISVSAGVISHSTSGVSSASYKTARVTVDTTGHITSASTTSGSLSISNAQSSASTVIIGTGVTTIAGQIVQIYRSGSSYNGYGITTSGSQLTITGSAGVLATSDVVNYIVF